MLENVAPGRYRVRVDTSLGFVSSIESGGTDLQRQPLVVGAGAAPPPIEVTVRDDGAEVEGTIEGAGGSDTAGKLVASARQYQRIVYFLPMDSSGGQWKQASVSPDGKFHVPNSSHHARTGCSLSIARSKTSSMRMKKRCANMIPRHRSSAWSPGRKCSCNWR